MDVGNVCGEAFKQATEPNQCDVCVKELCDWRSDGLVSTVLTCVLREEWVA